MLLTSLMAVLLAAENASIADAKRLFESGRSHAKAGRYEQACEAFAASLEHQRTLGTLINLASCSERLARFPEAWRFADEAALAADQSSDPRGALARALQERVSSRVAFVQVFVSNLSKPGEALVDDVTSVLAEPVTQLVVPLGEVGVTLRAPGRLTVTTRLTLSAREVVKLEPWKVALSSVEDAKAHPWFVVAPARKVSLTLRRAERSFPYFGIPSNGCAGGSVYLSGVLSEAVDELTAGTEIIVRAHAAVGKPGSLVTLNALRRAGLGPSRTPVFCEGSK